MTRTRRRMRARRYAATAVIGAALATVVAVQWPEIQRYLKIARM